jgi:hypothetical protein
MIYIFTDSCQDSGDAYEGYAEGPADFDFSELQARYWAILHAWRYKPDGSTITIGDVNGGYEVPTHPGCFGDFVIANNSAFRSLETVAVIGI